MGACPQAHGAKAFTQARKSLHTLCKILRSFSDFLLKKRPILAAKKLKHLIKKENISMA